LIPGGVTLFILVSVIIDMFGSGGYIPPLQLPQELSRILQPDPFFRSNEVFTCSSVRILKMSIGSIPGTPTEEIVGEHS
jgi:hypothetical protein